MDNTSHALLYYVRSGGSRPLVKGGRAVIQTLR